jgi:hypothetical protein
MSNLRILMRRDLRERKGITFSRQHIARLIGEGKFPPPDGKTSDSPTAPNWWFETTIDGYLKARAKALSARRKTAAEAVAEAI